MPVVKVLAPLVAPLVNSAKVKAVVPMLAIAKMTVKNIRKRRLRPPFPVARFVSKITL